MADIRPLFDADLTRSELDAVTAFLRPRREGATVLEIAQGSHLPVTVVVPLLDLLLAEGVVNRRCQAGGTGTQPSTFMLTSAGRRGARRNAARPA